MVNYNDSLKSIIWKDHRKRYDLQRTDLNQWCRKKKVRKNGDGGLEVFGIY